MVSLKFYSNENLWSANLFGGLADRGLSPGQETVLPLCAGQLESEVRTDASEHHPPG